MDAVSPKLLKKLPPFKATTQHDAMPPRQCRHISGGRAEPFRQLYLWSARDQPDIIGPHHIHYVVCIKCWSVFEDFARE